MDDALVCLYSLCWRILWACFVSLTESQPVPSRNLLLDKQDIDTINRSVSQSINQSVNQSINQSIDESINRSIDQSISQSVSQSVNQYVNSSMCTIIDNNSEARMLSCCIDPDFVAVINLSAHHVLNNYRRRILTYQKWYFYTEGFRGIGSWETSPSVVLGLNQ